MKKKLLTENSYIGVIGGTGIYKLSFLKNSKFINITTPYGNTSGPILIGSYSNTNIAFIPRHGYKHLIPPHKIPYKANLYALKSIGVKHIIATCIAGSLKKSIKPGTLVIPDQFLNFTWGRDDTFDIEKKFIHLAMSNPYCKQINNLLIKQLTDLRLLSKKLATVVVIQGPRFSTIAESKMYSKLGGDIINMTQYPECYFAKELGICYGVIASITDYDVGLSNKFTMELKSIDGVLAIFKKNIVHTENILKKIILNSSLIKKCSCANHHIDEYYKMSKSR